MSDLERPEPGDGAQRRLIDQDIHELVAAARDSAYWLGLVDKERAERLRSAALAVEFSHLASDV